MTDGASFAETGRVLCANVLGRSMRLMNQRCRDWSQHYDCVRPPHQTLSDAGCGLFSIAHCVEFMTGHPADIDALTRFSLREGGRSDDGTDRPVLLDAMQRMGYAAALGFAYRGEGHLNDCDRVFSFLFDARGTALANLRVGHIVALVAARECGGEKQVLALDSYSESADDRVRPHVRQCLPDTLCVSQTRNEHGVPVGYACGYMAYWVAASVIRDVNLLCAGKCEGV